MDITSLYTVISNDEGPLTLKHFLDHLIGPIGANHNHVERLNYRKLTSNINRPVINRIDRHYEMTSERTAEDS